MKIKTLPICLFTLVVVFTHAVSQAQNTVFSYQGNLNVTGTPANGNHDFEFALFDVVSGGAQVGSTLTRNNVNVTNGVFSVSLDFGSQFPGANRFLEIRVRPSGGGAFTPLSPRQAVNSSPYSVTSLNANQLGGVAASQYVTSGAAAISGGTQFNIAGSRVLSASGTNNTFLGLNSGLSNTGTSNSFFGNAAGRANTGGVDNSFFGNSAGDSNLTGNRNSFFGKEAGNANTSGTDNSFFGRRAGHLSTTGSGNSFFGVNAGNSNTTGGSNTYVGAFAGETNPSGSSNSFFGAESDSSIGLANATAIGAHAFVTQSNSLVLGSISAVNGGSADTNVGIGTTAPTQRLHVVGSGLFTGDLNVNGTLSATGASTANVFNALTRFDLGGQRVLSITGTNNVFAGIGAGASTTGASNSFVGFNAGLSTTTGTANSFFGASAGQDNIDGADNAFFGVNTGRGNTSGSRNTFLGRLAGRNSTTGSDNTFVGYSAGNANGSGDFNTAFGSGAGQSSTGNSNAFFGGSSGNSNIGGTSNSFFGRLSGNANTEGNENSFFGRGAGDNNTTGSRNTMLGGNARTGANNLTNATAIGARALVTQSNSLILGSISGVNTAVESTNVGIGTTAPSNLLTIGQPENTLANNPLVGIYGAGGATAVVRDTTNNVEAIVATNTNGAIFGSMSDHEVFFRSNNVNRFRINTSGNVVFSQQAIFSQGTSLFAPLHLASGSWTLEGNESLCYVFISNSPSETTIRPSICTSKAKFKENFANFKRGLDLVKKLQPLSFTWKASHRDDIGLIAEEVEAVEPLLVSRDNKGEPMGVRYDRVGIVLINAVKEQQAQIDEQKRLIDAQQKQIDALKQLVCGSKQAREDLSLNYKLVRGCFQRGIRILRRRSGEVRRFTFLGSNPIEHFLV